MFFCEFSKIPNNTVSYRTPLGDCPWLVRKIIPKFPVELWSFNPLMPCGNKKVTLITLSATVLFKYVWPLCYHQVLKVNFRIKKLCQNVKTGSLYWIKLIPLFRCAFAELFWNNTLFYISNTFISQKIKQKLSNTLRLNFCFLKIIGFLNPRYDPKVIGDIQKELAKRSYVCFNEVMWLIKNIRELSSLTSLD